MAQVNLKIISKTLSEARRLTIAESKMRNFEFIKEKIQNALPGLRGAAFKVFWKDCDGDLIRVTGDEDLVIAFSEMNGNTKVLYVESDASCPFADTYNLEGLKGMAQQYLEPWLTALNSQVQGDNGQAQALVEMLRNAADGFFGKNNNPEEPEQTKTDNSDETKTEAELKIEKGLAQLQEMGFDHDNVFLRKILEHFDGNVDLVLSILTK